MGGTTTFLLRATRRTAGRGLLVLVLIIAVSGTAVLVGVEAYRRSESAFGRLVRSTEAWDVQVNPNYGIDSALDSDAVAALPMVERFSRTEGIDLFPPTIESPHDLDGLPITFASDGHWGYDLARPVVRDGRLPDPDAADELFASTAAAENLGLEVGDTLHARLVAVPDLQRIFAGGNPDPDVFVERYNRPDTGEMVDLRLVGTGDVFDQVVQDEGYLDGTMFVTPAFYAAHHEPTGGFWNGLATLRPGASTDDFQAAVQAMVPDEPISFRTQAEVEAQVDRSLRPQVLALGLFAVLAAAVGVVVVGQAVARHVRRVTADLAPLGALGVTRGQRAQLAVLRVVVAGAAGAVLAVLLAVVASPIAPVGAVRAAEPDLGIRVDVTVLVVGGVLIVVVFAVLSVIPAVRATRRAPVAQPSGPGQWAARAGLGPATVAGTRFAFDRAGVSGSPTRPTLVGAMTSVGLVTGVLAFGAALDRFVDTGTLYGTPWSDVIHVNGIPNAEPDDYQRIADGMAGIPGVTAVSAVYPGEITLDGKPVPAIAIEPTARPVSPTLLSGRAPNGDDEIALGARTADRLGVGVGDTVTVSNGDDTAPLTVVGIAVLPAIGSIPFADRTTTGDGALAPVDLLERWGPFFGAHGLAVELDGITPDQVIARYDPPSPLLMYSGPAVVPSDVQSLDRVRSTPFVLVSLLAVLIALTVAHALSTAVRGRRGELAVLRSLGFTRGQVVGTVTTQSLLIALVGLLVGIPVGVVAGRLAWSQRVEHLGGVVQQVTPILPLVGLVVAVLALATVVALPPGLHAARAHPADTLRTE